MAMVRQPGTDRVRSWGMSKPLEGQASRPAPSLAPPITLAFPAGAVVVQLPPPATVTQHNSEAHYGLPARDFKRLCAEGKLPGKRMGRIWAVDYEAGRRALTERVAREVAATQTARPPAESQRAVEARPDADDDGSYAAGILAAARAKVAAKEARKRSTA